MSVALADPGPLLLPLRDLVAAGLHAVFPPPICRADVVEGVAGNPAFLVGAADGLRLTRIPGVPREAIAIEPGGDGTAESARSRWAQSARPARLLVVADRSHTRRIATLLRARLPATTVVMRAAREDGFDETRWWRDRSMTREIVMESLRWANSALLGNLWTGNADER